MDPRLRSRDDDSGPGPDLEARLARIPFRAPPADLKSACFRPHRSRVEQTSAPDGNPGLWLRLWSDLVRPHPLAWGSLAAAWAVILGLRLTTPDIPSGGREVLVQVPEETRKAAAAERAALMASLRLPESEPSNPAPAQADRKPRRDPKGGGRTLSPRSETPSADRWA